MSLFQLSPSKFYDYGIFPRSYSLFNLPGSNVEILSDAELQRLIPGRKVCTRIISWNIGLKSLDSNVDVFKLVFQSKTQQNNFDLIIINLQEIRKKHNDIFISFQSTLGLNYTLVFNYCHGALLTLIFVKREYIWALSKPKYDYLTIKHSIKTKGVIILSFYFFGTLIIVLNNHLSAHENHATKRLIQIKRIEKKLQDFIQKNYKDNEPDFIFWSGDFNSRSREKRNNVEDILLKLPSNKIFQKLLNIDELYNAMNEFEILKNFSEGKINFYPTYKFDRNSNIYDTSKKNRVPSYTDRIFFYQKLIGTLYCLDYMSIENYTISDHKPIYGTFSLQLKAINTEQAFELAYGKFDRNTFKKGHEMRIFSMLNELHQDSESKKRCIIV